MNSNSIFSRKYWKNILSPEVPPVEPQREKKVNPKPQLLQLKVPNRIREAMDEIGCRNIEEGWGDECSYDFDEIRRAEDKESYLSISFRKHIEMVVKRGWTIRGKNQDFIKHVRERLWEIFILSGVSTKQLIRGIVNDTVRFSNAYIIFKRSDKFPISGNSYMWKGKNLKPIVGMFRADPSNMTPIYRTRGKRKKLVAWKHSRDNSNYYSKGQVFNLEDVMHIKWSDKGLLIGTPFAIPVLDDIRALRRVEEFVELVCSKHAFPLIHYKVGTDDAPAEVYEDGNGSTEIDEVRNEISEMPTEGCWVTSERHSIEAVTGAEGIDLEKYLKHFEDRVISGCGISGISLGRGGSANRSTASVIDKILIDRAWDIQDVIADAIDTHLLMHLHLDSKNSFGPDDMAHFNFYSPDTEEERSQENHFLNQYQSSAINEDELRESINRPPMNDDDLKKSYAERTTIYTQDRYAQLAKKYGYEHSFPGVKTPAATSSTSTATKSANKTQNKTRPTNQSGTKSTKTKVAVNNIKQEIRNLKHTFLNINNQKFPINIPMAKSFFLTAFDSFINTFQQKVYSDLTELSNIHTDVNIKPYIGDCCKKIKENYLQSIYASAIIKLDEEVVDIGVILDTLEQKLINLLEDLQDIYNKEFELGSDGEEDE